MAVFVLVTPAEKLDIAVEDAPFVAVEVKSEGERRRAPPRLPPQHRRSSILAGPEPSAQRFAIKHDDGPHPYLACPRRARCARRARGLLRTGRTSRWRTMRSPPGVWSDGVVLPAIAPTHDAGGAAARRARGRWTARDRPCSRRQRSHRAPTRAIVRADAAVLVRDRLIRPAPGMILLTQRTETVAASHAGQVAFPGGRDRSRGCRCRRSTPRCARRRRKSACRAICVERDRARRTRFRTEHRLRHVTPVTRR